MTLTFTFPHLLRVDFPQLYMTGLVCVCVCVCVCVSEDLARLPHEPLRDLKPTPIGKCQASPEKVSCMGRAVFLMFLVNFEI